MSRKKFEIDDFDDPEIRNLIHKLNGILEDIYEFKRVRRKYAKYNTEKS